MSKEARAKQDAADNQSSAAAFLRMTEEVLTRDLSSGRIHRRALLDGVAVPQSYEADNLDDAGEYEVITAEQLADVEPGELCERCFPPIGDSEDAA